MILRLLILIFFLPTVLIAQPIKLNLSDNSPEEVVIRASDSDGSDIEKPVVEETEEEKTSREAKENAFIYFEYQSGEGTKIPVAFSFWEVFFGVVFFLLAIAIPLIILWKKARDLGVNDMGSSESFTSGHASDGSSPKGNPLAKYLEPGVEVAEIPKSNYKQSAPSSASATNAMEHELISAPQSSGLSFPDYIQSLLDQHYLAQETGTFVLPVKPNGRKFLGAESQKILILPRMENVETFALALEEHDQVIVFVDEKTIFEIRNVAS